MSFSVGDRATLARTLREDDPPHPVVAPHWDSHGRDPLAIFFERHPLPAWIYDLETLQFLAVNDSAAGHYGYSRDEFLAMTLFDVRPVEEASDLLDAIKQVRLGGQSRSVRRHRKKSGEIIDVEVRGYAATFAGRPAEYVTLLDVTDRRRNEDLERRRVHELNVLNRIGAICSNAADEDELLHRATEIIAEALAPDNCGFLILDPLRGELTPHASFVLTDAQVVRTPIPLDRGIVGRVARTGTAARIGNVAAEPNYLRSDSRMQSELCVPMAIGGSVVGVFNAERAEVDAFSDADERLAGAMVDVVGNALERLRGNRRLAASERKFRALFEQCPDAIFLMELDGPQAGTIVDANVVAGRLHDCAPDELVGTNIRDLDSPESASRVEARMEWLRLGHVLRAEVAHRRRDGTLVPLDMQSSVVQMESRRLILAFDRDVSERKAAEARLRELEAETAQLGRLHVVGEMAAGLAHELNQPLAAIANYAAAASNLLSGGKADTAQILELLAKTSEQSLRAGEIIRWLRGFIARRPPKYSKVDVAELVGESLRMAEVDLAKRGIKVVRRLAEGLPAIEADRVQLQQVLLNLIRNACDAMEQTAVDQRELSVTTALKSSEKLEITLSDRGCGIREDVAARLFEPFVSSRPDGLGLGLAICRRIVEAHEGILSAAPNPNGGAAFRIELPIQQEGSQRG